MPSGPAILFLRIHTWKDVTHRWEKTDARTFTAVPPREVRWEQWEGLSRGGQVKERMTSMQVRMADASLPWHAVYGRGAHGNRARQCLVHCGLIYTYRHTQEAEDGPAGPRELDPTPHGASGPDNDTGQATQPHGTAVEYGKLMGTSWSWDTVLKVNAHTPRLESKPTLAPVQE